MAGGPPYRLAVARPLSWRRSQAAAGAHLGGLLGADSDGQADVCCAFAWLKKMKWKQVR